MDGHCTCGAVGYRLTRAPIFTLACHCTWCQRETGSAFALLALIESAEIDESAAPAEVIAVPSPSGLGQWVRRCPICKVALWSHYGAAGPGLAFVRVGTLAEPGALPPEVFCYAATKPGWLRHDGRIAVEQGAIDDAVYMAPESLARLKALETPA